MYSPPQLGRALLLIRFCWQGPLLGAYRRTLKGMRFIKLFGGREFMDRFFLGQDAPISGKIYSQLELDQMPFDSNAWQAQSLHSFMKIVTDAQFPCFFARKAMENKLLKIMFCRIKSTHEDRYMDFFNGMMTYTQFIKTTKLEERLLTPLIVFFEADSVRKVLRWHSVAWEALNWIHEHDPVCWPQEIPLECEDPKWCFCFNDVQLFINMSTEEHKILRSRNLGKGLVLVVNSRESFDRVAHISTKSGQRIREKIRVRNTAFNEGIAPGELGFYGAEDNLEWQQYQLFEEGLEKPLVCPLGERTESERGRKS